MQGRGALIPLATGRLRHQPLTGLRLACPQHGSDLVRATTVDGQLMHYCRPVGWHIPTARGMRG